MTVAWAAVEKMTMSYNNFNLHQNEACKFYVVQMIPRNLVNLFLIQIFTHAFGQNKFHEN